MIPEGDAQALIERLEKHAGRSRPFLVYGLVAILAGFLVLTYYINGLRQAAERRADYIGQLRNQEKARNIALELKKAELNQRIDRAGELATRQYSPAEAVDALKAIKTILAAASETTAELNPAAAGPPTVAAATHEPDVGPPPVPAKPVPGAEPVIVPAAAPRRPSEIRIFLHIADKAQFGGATELRWSLSSGSVDGAKVVVPGIEMVDSADDTLRCLKRQDCERVEQVAALVNSKLVGRTLGVRKLHKRYEHTRGLRPGTYEVWLGPGPVKVAAN